MATEACCEGGPNGCPRCRPILWRPVLDIPATLHRLAEMGWSLVRRPPAPAGDGCKRLREALAYYADEANYDEDGAPVYTDLSPPPGWVGEDFDPSVRCDLGQLARQALADAEPAGDCLSCGEGNPRGECPRSQRPCGHHCNHSWSHDACSWCEAEFGEVQPPAPADGDGLDPVEGVTAALCAYFGSLPDEQRDRAMEAEVRAVASRAAAAYRRPALSELLTSEQAVRAACIADAERFAASSGLPQIPDDEAVEVYGEPNRKLLAAVAAALAPVQVPSPPEDDGDRGLLGRKLEEMVAEHRRGPREARRAMEGELPSPDTDGGA